jgi:selenide,water dikinase
VLIGGGHSHVAVLKEFGKTPVPGVRLTLITRDVMTPYSGMLPGLIAGHYTFKEAHIDLALLARFAGAALYNDQAVALDLSRQQVICLKYPPIPFDLLSIDIGSTPVLDVPGAAEHGVPVKPIDQFLVHWHALCQRVLHRAELTRIGVVGGGAGGVELLLAVQYRLRQWLAQRGKSTAQLEFHLLTATPDILPTHNPRVRAKFRRVFTERAVHVHPQCRVARVDPGALTCENGLRLALDEMLWATQAGAAPWLAETGLAVDEQGFIRVNRYLQSPSHAAIFAVGDIASMDGQPRPKAGVFAVRQGPPLAANLRRVLLGQPLRAFIPQRHFLGLISTGDQYAIASRSQWALEGRWLWHWKDWIDRRFMRRYNGLSVSRTKQFSMHKL